MNNDIFLSLSDCLDGINWALPRFVQFVGDFTSYIISENVNVISDADGGISAQVPASMDSARAAYIKEKVLVLDRVIDSQNTTLQDYFRQGFAQEAAERARNPGYVSVLADKHAEFTKVASSYRHFPK